MEELDSNHVIVWFESWQDFSSWISFRMMWFESRMQNFEFYVLDSSNFIIWLELLFLFLTQIKWSNFTHLQCISLGHIKPKISLSIQQKLAKILCIACKEVFPYPLTHLWNINFFLNSKLKDFFFMCWICGFEQVWKILSENHLLQPLTKNSLCVLILTLRECVKT